MEPAGPPTAPKRHRRRIRKLRLTALIGLLLALAFVAFTFGFVRAIASEIPALDPQQWSGEVDGYVYANDGKTILAVLRGDESRVLIESDQISPWMKQAIVADPGPALLRPSRDRRARCRASTLGRHPEPGGRPGRLHDHAAVRQDAWVKNRRTLARKFREAALSWQLEQLVEDRILTPYLNTIYFGNGAYGIQRAAKVYFGKGAAES